MLEAVWVCIELLRLHVSILSQTLQRVFSHFLSVIGQAYSRSRYSAIFSGSFEDRRSTTQASSLHAIGVNCVRALKLRVSSTALGTGHCLLCGKLIRGTNRNFLHANNDTESRSERKRSCFAVYGRRRRMGIQDYDAHLHYNADPMVSDWISYW